ncbi:MAG: 2-dehydro-3-deoxygalactonokinase [Chitinophagaceae bacterium]
MSKFISCDWGTSNLRLRLVDRDRRVVLLETETNEGIAAVHHSWKNEPGEQDRLFYYLSILKKHIVKWKGEDGVPLQNIPVLVSGMASSTIGIIELEYAQIPFRADGSDLVVKKIGKSAVFPFPLFIVSGASTDADVMRGEETLLAGCDTVAGGTELFIFPGTHSKHVIVTNGIAHKLATYMTGEFFSLLSRHSILAASVEQQENKEGGVFFERGIIDGSERNLLNSAFGVRINHLFKKATAADNFHYLSGLVIGTELRAFKENDISLITVAAGDTLMNKYVAGLNLLEPGKKINQVKSGTALVNGHCRIISSLLNNNF